MKKLHPLLRGAIGCLVLWAFMVSLAVAHRAAMRLEAPERRMYEWAQLLGEAAQKHGGQLTGWNAAGMLEQFLVEETRPYQRLALVDVDGRVVASYPAGWEGQSLHEIMVGDAPLVEMLNQPPYFFMKHGYVWAPEAMDVPFPYSRTHLLADSVWLQLPYFPRGLLVAIRPGMAYGEVWNSSRGTVVPWRDSWKVEGRTPWVGMIVYPLGYLSFLGYWLLLAAWVYQDARARGERALPWGIIALSTNLLGVGAYLLARPSQRCPSCERHLAQHWSYCPYCGAQKHTA